MEKLKKHFQKKWSVIFLAILIVFSAGCDPNYISPNSKSSNGDFTFGKVKKQKIDQTLWQWNEAVPDPCKQVCLVAGQHQYVGTVDAAYVDEGILVTYDVTEPDIYLTEVHLDIFESLEQFGENGKLSGGGAKLGQFAYQMSWDEYEMVTSHSILIPTEYIEAITSNSCLNIASHAVLNNGETAYGGICDQEGDQVSLDNAKQFPGSNWSVYFEFCTDECQTVVDFTYAWEDINEDIVQTLTNDADYNDLVIKSDVIKTPTQLNIRTLAVARGASFNHVFKIRIPKQGIVGGADGIFGEVEVIDDGDSFVIVVLTSTKNALPAENFQFPFAANTSPDDNTCEPNKEVYIQITIDENFDYNPNRPYDPFITVFPGNWAPLGTRYDLNIWELHNSDGTGDIWTTMEDGELKSYPNGIIISEDWQWPTETTHIQSAYYGFSSITDGWNADWFNSLDDSSQIWDCN